MSVGIERAGELAALSAGRVQFEKWAPVLGLVILLVIVLGLLWIWVVRHERDFRSRWRAFSARPRVAALGRRFERQLRFLQDRLTPGGYLGLHLTVGALIILAGVWMFVEIADELLENDTMVAVDHRVSGWMQSHGTPGVTRVAHFITGLGSTAFIASASAAVIWMLVRWRSWYRLLAYSVAVLGGALLNYILKVSFERARPTFETPLVTLDSYSFPSGHTMGATVFYGALALSALLYAHNWRLRWRLLAVFVAVLLIVLIGFTRIYLGAHFLSDVVGATTIGVAWLMASHTGVEIFRLRDQERKRAADQ
jgi:membrane-associated phospholipid phosphatase